MSPAICNRSTAYISEVFGWIETVFGAAKIIIVFIMSGILLYAAGHSKSAQHF